MVLISGICAIDARILLISLRASVTDKLGCNGTLIQIEPSFSSGKNSVPSLGTTARLPANMPAATSTTFLRWLKAHFNTGS